MIRRLFPYFLVLLSVLLDTSVLPMVSRNPNIPLITMMTAVTLGLLLGRTRGALFGLIGGLLLDILVCMPLGFRTTMLLGCGFLSGIAGRKYRRHLLMTLMTPLICFAAHDLAIAAYLYMTSAQVEMEILRGALLRVPIGMVAVQPMYLLYNKLLKPEWSYYAA